MVTISKTPQSANLREYCGWTGNTEDDIVTTGKTATAFIDRMISAGANVKMAFFLAKTKYFKRYNN